jgi:hypothetical protein
MVSTICPGIDVRAEQDLSPHCRHVVREYNIRHCDIAQLCAQGAAVGPTTGSILPLVRPYVQ